MGIGVQIDVTRAHPARMYDFQLGGKTNYEADRVAVAELEKIFPTAKLCARTNRAFMARATQHAAKQGVRQFLDIGTGIPTAPNLHQVAQEVDPAARVIYVDNDPIVLAHARALMLSTTQGRTAYLEADVRAPNAILDAVAARDILDLSRPVALSVIAVMHFVPDEDQPYEIVSTLLAALPAGSYLTMTHGTGDYTPQLTARGVAAYQVNRIPLRGRSRAEFTRFFDGLDLVEPGVTVPHRWHSGIEPPASMDAKVSLYAGMARKP